MNEKTKDVMHVGYKTTPTLYIEVSGIRYAYRRIGHEGGIPIVYLNHLAANLDNCDPLIMDSLAQHFTVISFDYRGIGGSGGSTADNIEEVARDTAAFIRALGYDRVHLLGLSFGGFVAQELLRIAPDLVAHVILAGTSPRGNRGTGRVARITYYDMLRGGLTGRDPRYYLFFPISAEAREAGQAFISRTAARQDRDRAVGLSALLAQLKAVRRWAKAERQDLSGINHRVWVVNGDNDRMLPTEGSYELAERLPNASLSIYDGAGHGAIFQRAESFVHQAIAFYLVD